tara:strand:+ start:10063 stop:10296 length:234 start_codon:yes stop_codon:yes gene_type:complete
MKTLEDWELKEILASQGMHVPKETFNRARELYNSNNGVISGDGINERISKAIENALSKKTANHDDERNTEPTPIPSN